MKVLCLVLYIVAIGFCVAGFLGHSAAWAAAALSSLAASMVAIGLQKKKDIED